LKYGVLYATTNYYRENLYVSGEPLFSDTDLWTTQQEILKVLGRSGTTVAFKPHPRDCNEKHFKKFLEDKKIENITIIKDMAFPELVACAGLVVIDTPTTTLLQAIATRKPVFVLTRHLHLNEDADKLLRKRVYCCESRDKFLFLLGRYLITGPLPDEPDVENREFLEWYGVYRDDGKVAERVLSVFQTEFVCKT
jgi:hypothetical protein